MDSRILLGRILQRFEDRGVAGDGKLNSFKYIRETESSVIVQREKRTQAVVPHKKILYAIEYYKRNQSAYSKGPAELRKAGITHVTSPIYALIHLLKAESFK